LLALEDRIAPVVRTVTSLADTGLGTLRSQLTSALSGDTINFDSSLTGGTITLASPINLTAITNVTITGPGASNLTVSGGGTTRILSFDLFSSATITGLTFANAHANDEANPVYGGAIQNSGHLVVSNCVFTNNVATSMAQTAEGGAIYNGLAGGTGGGPMSNTLILNNDVFTNNHADDLGGAISDRVIAGSLTATNCVFNGNYALRGGDIDGYYDVTLSGDYFHDSVSDPAGILTAGIITGGALYLVNGGIADTTTHTITQLITNSTFSHNNAIYGGAIATGNSNTVTVNNSTIYGNTGVFGGGLYATGSLNVESATITANNASSSGGGIHAVGGGTIALKNNIVAGNTEGSTAGGFRGDDVVALVTATSDHNLIGDGTGLVALDASLNPIDLNGVNGNMIGTVANPINPGLSDLRLNGGTVPTVALLVGSPAFAAGVLDSTLLTDQNGVTRSATPNMGAVEYQATVVRAIAFVGPSSVATGTPFDIIVRAVDQYGNVVTNYAGTVDFMASTGASAMYTFTTGPGGDNGSHTFHLPALPPLGDITITGTDSGDMTITGSYTFNVS
jgi:hypothetical protein